LDQGEEDTEDASYAGIQAKNRVLKDGWHDLSEETNGSHFETKSVFRLVLRTC